jgi:hypothetical protein
MDCRNERAKRRKARMAANGGSHTEADWQKLLAFSPRCAVCNRLWADIPPRPDPRYKYVWTKGHKQPVYAGGTDDIENIQPECYQCNFKTNAGPLGPRTGNIEHSKGIDAKPSDLSTNRTYRARRL